MANEYLNKVWVHIFILEEFIPNIKFSVKNKVSLKFYIFFYINKLSPVKVLI
jgi:hypothetical protein